MSVHGTKRTLRPALSMSASGGKADSDQPLLTNLGLRVHGLTPDEIDPHTAPGRLKARREEGVAAGETCNPNCNPSAARLSKQCWSKA